MKLLVTNQETKKSILLAVRVTPRISKIVEQVAIREGLTISEWLRNLILRELKRTNMLNYRFYEPKIGFQNT